MLCCVLWNVECGVLYAMWNVESFDASLGAEKLEPKRDDKRKEIHSVRC